MIAGFQCCFVLYVGCIRKTEFTGEDLNLETYDLETYLRDIIEELEWVHHKLHPLVYHGVGKRVEAEFDRKLMRRAITNLQERDRFFMLSLKFCFATLMKVWDGGFP